MVHVGVQDIDVLAAMYLVPKHSQDFHALPPIAAAEWTVCCGPEMTGAGDERYGLPRFYGMLSCTRHPRSTAHGPFKARKMGDFMVAVYGPFYAFTNARARSRSFSPVGTSVPSK